MSETYEQFLALVKARHTCRGFSADPLPDNAVEKILEAARWAMSGANSQPREFIVVGGDAHATKRGVVLRADTIVV